MNFNTRGHVYHPKLLSYAAAVGVGTDFDGISCPPDQLENVSGMPSITKELLKRNYNEADIKKILGGNFMRIFAEVCG